MKKVITRAVNLEKNNNRKSTKREKILYVVAFASGLFLLMTIIGSIFTVITFTAFSSTLPSPTRLTNRDIEQSTKIFDRNGELLYSVYESKDRTLVTIDEISPYIIEATLAAEDSEFYKHQGIDPLSIARSAYNTLVKEGTQGGSTITQQVAKNALLTQDRTIQRKIKDMVLALQIENSYTKDEILQMYLNEVPYGGSIYGVEEASKAFFDKSAKELTLPEAALIAGLPQSPTRYSPLSNPEAARNRQKYVLWLMKERGWIDREGVHHKLSEEDYNSALEQELEFAQFKGTIKAPHFVMYVLSLIREKYGEEVVNTSGLNVVTTLDLSLQDKFQEIVNNEVETEGKRLGFSNGALVAIDPQTHEVLAMVGSKDYFAKDIDGQFNVTTGKRQPGSALKPITYLTALTQGYTASSVIYDVYTEFDRGEGQKPYTPKNYGGWGFRGPMQIRYALANSVNITAVKMLDLVGINNMVKMANSLGIKSLYYDPSKHGLAITLGGVEVPLLELTNGFATLGASGIYKDITPIFQIKTSDGTVLETANDSPGQRVVDERYVWILSDILSDNSARSAAFGSNSKLNIPGNKVAVKTGTTNDLKDNWTVGYTDKIAIGVWVGNNDGKEMNNSLASGLTGAAPIWHEAMKYYLSTNPHPEFTKPEGIESTWVGIESGMVPYDGKEDRRMEYFVKGTEPTAKSTIYQRVKICKDGDVKDRVYTVYEAEKPEWQVYVENWVRNKFKDNEDEMYMNLDPKYDMERDSDKFDIENCNNKEED